MNPLRLLLLLVALLVIGGGTWYLMDSDHGPAPTDETAAPIPAPEDKQSNPGALAAPAPVPKEAPPAPGRREVKIDHSKSESAQGVKGVVVTPAGAPEANCNVFLVESAQGTEIFRMMQLAQRGVTLPPVASTVTDNAGAFALGVEVTEPGKVYEVRVVSNTYADFVHPNVRLLDGKWYDAGQLQLQNGLTLSGQVVVAGGSGMPIGDAEVSIRSTGAPFEVSLVPGREKGIVVKTTPSGHYRATNVPAGVHTVAAVAPGYARVVHPNVTVTEQTENRLDFELAQGLAISGRVLDSEGNGIARAKVTAIAMSSKTPVNADAFADENGKFEILGLLEGPYQVTAKAEGFVDVNEKPINAGTKDLELVAERQGSVRVTVVGKNGQYVREYTVTVKSYFSGQPAPVNPEGPTPNVPPPAAVEPSYGNTMIPVQNVRNPKDGVATISGMDPGTYALQINARGYAMAFSEPFTLAADAQSPQLTVQMNEGGVIAGLVVNSNGQPIGNATVETRPNDLDDNPFTAMFATLIPAKITRTQAQTDEQGRFELKMLNAGRYQLKVTHPEYVETFKKDHDVVVGQTLTLQPIVLPVGSVLSGVVRVAGKPTGQVKVTVSAKADPNLTQQRTAGFMCDAFTDNEGRYVLPKRLSPGLYEVMAAQQTLSNPLLQIVQFQRSKQDLSVGGQAQLLLDFNLEETK
jgi:uncharacterized GH25 family protein